MWNSFRLMTSLSLGDVKLCSNIGFYPDDALSFVFSAGAGPDGQGVCNNSSVAVSPVYTGVAGDMSTPLTTQPGISGSVFDTELGNVGFRQRQKYISFDPTATPTGASAYGALLSAQSCQQLWKSLVYEKVSGVAPAPGPAVVGRVAIAIMATVYLKHIHSFFSMVPLLKGIFLKMTMNLNNTSTTFTVVNPVPTGTPTTATVKAGTALTSMTLTSVSNPVGGVCPLMIASGSTFQPSIVLGSASYIATVQVGARCLNSSVAVAEAPLAKSIYLYVPAYTFNPVFEQSYLSSPIKQIKYTDVYQYKVVGVGAGQQFNNLLTNGIANIKSVLIIPFYSETGAGAGTGLPAGLPVYQSPFDPAGTGPTSPLCLLGNFNVVVSGQNAIYNTQRYAFEQFNNQLKGQNSVNGDLTDGLTSSLVSSLDFEMEYCYYYVNVSRMLPVEESVPKSIQIIGTNYSAKAVDLQCFVEYGVDISIDSLTGSRV